MSVDLSLAGLLLVFAVLGAFSGAIRQLSHWAGLALAYFAAGPIALRLTPLLAPKLGLPAIGVRVVLSSLLFGALYAAGTLLFHGAAKKIVPGREGGRTDRGGGFLLGGAKGAALVYVVLSVALFFEKPLAGAFGPLPEPVRESKAVSLARRHNLFETASFPALARIERLMEAARDPKKARREPELRRWLDDPRLKALVKDEALVKALRSGDTAALRNVPQLAALFEEIKRAEENAGSADSGASPSP